MKLLIKTTIRLCPPPQTLSKALTANAAKCSMLRTIIFTNQIANRVSGKAEKEVKTQSQEEITLTNTLKESEVDERTRLQQCY